jgi:hypothetical protein
LAGHAGPISATIVLVVVLRSRPFSELHQRKVDGLLCHPLSSILFNRIEQQTEHEDDDDDEDDVGHHGVGAWGISSWAEENRFTPLDDRDHVLLRLLKSPQSTLPSRSNSFEPV